LFSASYTCTTSRGTVQRARMRSMLFMRNAWSSSAAWREAACTCEARLSARHRPRARAARLAQHRLHLVHVIAQDGVRQLSVRLGRRVSAT
jgi:hypothetical protein